MERIKPTDLPRIIDFLGERVEVPMKDGSIVFGVLVFYNWDQQIIHLSDYEHNVPNDSDEGYEKKKGKFRVINCREWRMLDVC